MPEDPTHIFLSYAKEDAEVARRLYFDLRNLGFKPWIDSEDLLPGQRWGETIRLAIRASKLFLVLISRASLNKRGFVQKEITQALDVLEEFPRGQIFVVPIRLEACAVTDEKLSGLQWVDIFPSYQKGLEKLLRSIPEELSSLAASKRGKEAVRDSVQKERSEVYHAFLRTADGIMLDSKLHIKSREEGNRAAMALLNQKNGTAIQELQSLLQRIKLIASEAVWGTAVMIYTDAIGWRYFCLTPKLDTRFEKVTKEYSANHLPSFMLAARQDIGVFSIGEQAGAT